MGLVATEFSLPGYHHGGINETMLVEGNIGLVAIQSDYASKAILANSLVPPEHCMKISEIVARNLSLCF